MKVIYSLSEFKQKAIEIASPFIPGGDLYKNAVAVRVEFGVTSNKEFSCYAHGYSWYTAPTMEKALEMLRDAVCPEQGPKIDVEIEIEEEKIESDAEEK